MKRTIVQIAAMPGREGEVSPIFALADDGTLWEGYTRCIPPKSEKQTYRYEFQWEQLPALPDNTSNLTRSRND